MCFMMISDICVFRFLRYIRDADICVIVCVLYLF